MKRIMFLMLCLGLMVATVTAQDTDGVLDILTQGDSWDAANYYLPVIQEATGVTLELRVVPQSEYNQVRNVTVASGDLPDVIRIMPTDPVYGEYVEAGLLRPINDLLEQYPAVRDAYPPEVLEAVTYSDGNLYYLPRLTGFFPVTIAYRKDWADALNIEQPTTVEEFQAMLQAFADQDPGNVGDALIPFVPNRLSGGGAMLWLDPVTAPFGVNYMAWVPNEDASGVVLAHTLPGFKDAVAYARGLYTAGLLDQTWGVSTDRGLFKFYAGTVGATTDWPQFNHLRLEAIRTAFPDAEPEIAYITALAGPDGTIGGAQRTPIIESLASALTVAADDEEADAFFRLLEWQYTEGYELMALGVEGITYDLNDAGLPRRRGRDAVLAENPSYDLYMLDRVFFAEPPFHFEYSRQSPQWNDVPDEMFEYVTGVLSESETSAVINYGQNLADPEISANLPAIQAAVDEFITRAILSPDFDLDAEFDALQATLAANNLEAVTEAVNRLNPLPAM